MAAIFPKASDLVMKVGGLVLGLGMLTGVGAYVYFSYPTVIDTGYQPMQPVPYSHKLHVGQLGLDCFYCHSTVYKAAYAAIPATENLHELPHAGEGQESAPGTGASKLRDRQAGSVGEDSQDA